MSDRPFPSIPSQFGFATTAQLRERGFSEWELHEFALAGRRVTRAVYAATVGPWPEPLLRIAGGLWAGPAAALTGVASLKLWGVEDLPKPEVIRFLVPPDCRTRRNSLGMLTVRSRRAPRKFVRSDVTVASLERSLADAGRFKELSGNDLLAATLAMLHARRTTQELLAREVADGGDAGTRGVHEAIVAFRQGAWSRPEAVLGDAIRQDHRFPRMLSNPRLSTRAGVFVGVPDGYFPGEGVAVQVHSKKYHRGVDAAGADRWERTLARDLGYEEQQIHVVPVAPRTLYEDMGRFRDALAVVVSARRGQGPSHIVVD